MKKGTIGIIGAGAVVQQFYAPSLRKLGRDWKLLVFDLDAARARSVGAKLGGEGRMWQPPVTLDAAIVATPPASHYEVVADLLRNGTHVLCEKPFVMDVKEGMELVSLARDRGLALTVDQTRRFFPCSSLARDLIRSNAIGMPVSVQIREGNRFSWPSMTHFYFDHRARRNGVLADRGSHVFDLVSWLLDTPLTPTAVVTDGTKGPEATACVDFEAEGLEGTAVLSWLVDLAPELKIGGERGELVIGENWNRLTVTTAGRKRHLWGRARTKTFPELSHKVVTDFLGACAGRPSQSDAATVLPSIEFLQKAYDQARPDWPSEVFEVTP